MKTSTKPCFNPAITSNETPRFGSRSSMKQPPQPEQESPKCRQSPSSPCLLREDIGAPSEFGELLNATVHPQPARRSPIRFIPIPQQPSQTSAGGPSTPSHYYALGSTAVNGVTQLIVVRRERRYYSPPAAQAEPQNTQAPEETFVDRVMSILRHSVISSKTASPATEELDYLDGEDPCTLAVDPNLRPTKR
ncbi:hypothetical protein EYR40_002455 [Pleurotus pulmonarius]|nr:hypothetical protein EYR40_002455 [Pleurotus pulmonarius]